MPQFLARLRLPLRLRKNRKQVSNYFMARRAASRRVFICLHIKICQGEAKKNDPGIFKFPGVNGGGGRIRTDEHQR